LYRFPIFIFIRKHTPRVFFYFYFYGPQQGQRRGKGGGGHNGQRDKPKPSHGIVPNRNDSSTTTGEVRSRPRILNLHWGHFSCFCFGLAPHAHAPQPRANQNQHRTVLWASNKAQKYPQFYKAGIGDPFRRLAAIKTQSAQYGYLLATIKTYFYKYLVWSFFVPSGPHRTNLFTVRA
jgi:hypothetical protein